MVGDSERKGAEVTVKPLNRYEATEQEVQATIIEYLELRGIVHSVTDRSRHWDAQGRVRASRVSMPGYPDISCVIAGKAVYIEVKSTRGRLSHAQIACHARLREAGAVVVVARSLEDVQATIAFS